MKRLLRVYAYAYASSAVFKKEVWSSLSPIGAKGWSVVITGQRMMLLLMGSPPVS